MIFTSADYALRRFRDRIISRVTRRSGVEFLNAVLTAAGRDNIPQENYDRWLAELASDRMMEAAYNSAIPILTRTATAASARKTYGSWHERINKFTAIVDIYYALVRALQPSSIVETGVALGTSTSLMLAALHHNGAGGRLTSIDLPAVGVMSGLFRAEDVGCLVPTAYRNHWRLITEDAMTALPRVMASPPDIFSHDSEHTYRQMVFEFALALRTMKPRTVVISDDTQMNTAFLDVLGNCETFNCENNASLAAAVL